MESRKGLSVCRQGEWGRIDVVDTLERLIELANRLIV
jgi:hypothetical protein